MVSEILENCGNSKWQKNLKKRPIRNSKITYLKNYSKRDGEKNNWNRRNWKERIGEPGQHSEEKKYQVLTELEKEHRINSSNSRRDFEEKITG